MFLGRAKEALWEGNWKQGQDDFFFCFNVEIP